MEETTGTKAPTRLEIVRAATNDPKLAKRVVVLGDREFPVVDLEYDDYNLFLAQLQPLFEGMIGNIPGLAALGINAFNAGDIIRYCGKSLAEMGCIVCRQTAPDITVAEVKRLAKTPFKMAALVVAQIEQNNIISDLKDFFALVLPLMRAAKKNTSK